MRAVGKGAFQAMSNVADMVVHPIETVSGIGGSLHLVGHCAGKILHDAIILPYDYYYDHEQFEAICDEYYHNISWLHDTIENYLETTTWEEKVADGTTFVVEGILCAKMLKLFSSFCRVAKVKAHAYLKNPKKVFVAHPPEGIQIAFANKVSEAVAEFSQKAGGVSSRVRTKAYNFSQLFQEYEYWKKIKKLSDSVRGASWRCITKKIKGTAFVEGDIFYIDTLHWDHVEVFSKNGKFRRVLNFDGTVNERKTILGLKQNRSINKGR